MRVVIDTNIFISAIFWAPNYSSKILDLWMNEKIELVISIDMINELENTLLNFKKPFSKQDMNDLKNELLLLSQIVEPKLNVEIVKDDPDDNKFFEAAIEGNSKIIISQDKHLLKIGEYMGIIVFKPEEFLEFIK